MKKTLLYLGYAGFDNLGDDICFDAFCQWAQPLGAFVRVARYDLRNKRTIGELHAGTPLAGVMIGGGSLLQGCAFVEPALEAARLNLPLWMFGTGIDYFTEAYARRLADDAQPAGAPQMFDGKELKEDALRAILQKCRFAGVRGPLTRRYLAALAAPDKTAVIGDPGLIYQPREDASMLFDHPALGGRFAALNWGGSFGSIFGCNEQRTMTQAVAGARHLIARGYKLLIYPMWPGDIEPCHRIHQAIGRPDACALAVKVYPADAVCTMLKKAEVSAGLKLHAAVMSVRMGAPFLSLGYRSKCFDFALSGGFAERCVSTASPDIFAAIARLAEEPPDGRRRFKEAAAHLCSDSAQRYRALLGTVEAALQ